MEFVAFWFICSIASAAIAAARGLNGCLWAILGFLFGPIGLLLACVWPTPRPQLVTIVQPSQPQAMQPMVNQITGAPVALPSANDRECPFCISRIPRAASVCRYCQRDVPPA